MPRLFRTILATLVTALVPLCANAQSHADAIEQGGDLSNPANRRSAVAETQRIGTARRAAAWARADAAGWPRRTVLPNGAVRELVDFEGAQPIYFTTHNANAAISSGANLIRLAPYSLDGSGLTIGEWDGGSARATHQEFGGRVTVKDGSPAVDHATHVGGTIAAAGALTGAKGMAPAVRIDSYDWNSDRSEMTTRGATYPGEPGKLYLSNHSYGYVAGWNYTGKASPQWDWWGSGTTAAGVEDDFGKYSSYARDSDSLAGSLPYYLVFRSAGNDRGENPAVGVPVALSANGTTVVSYDPALHPAGDASYKAGGYDTISFDAVAKNVITVGGVFDAVNGSTRSPAMGSMTWFSSWGPTDDGRIKPDVVANGHDLYSSLSGHNAAYGWMSGTSMSSPSATGSAALLVSIFDKLFPGHAMRASTLKGLLIHTADDLGTAGPDYQNGWGLINVSAAADLVQAYRDNAGTRRIVEDRVTTSRTTVTQSFTWSGSGPIRVTLCWTDPAGTATNTGDSRTAKLVNNLNLQLIGPGGSVHQPFVMPYVGDWTAATLGAAATTGVNNTDNVEQVLIAAPPAAGVYQARVSFNGTLTNGVQPFSLLISGGTDSDAARPPSLASVSPASASGGVATLTLTGADVLLGAAVKLTRNGQADALGTGVETQGDSVKTRINTSGLARGSWNVVVTNPDGQSFTLPYAFSIVGALWAEQLEAGAEGWTHGATTGFDAWTLSSAQSHSASHAFLAPGAAARTDSTLVSPAISLPSTAANLRLTFWHNHDFQPGKDGGVLEFSINGGTWFDVTSSGSGAAFASGGYTSSLQNTGPPAGRNPLGSRKAWSGSSAGWTEVAVDLADAVKYAGKTLRIRWRLGSDSSTSSIGWYVDDIVIAGAGAANLAPSVATPATAASALVIGKTSALSVLATDDAGEAALTYTWSVNDEFDAPIVFSENGTNAAKNTMATFSKAGLFTFVVTARDAEGLTATSSVDVQVDQSLTAARIAPATAKLDAGESLPFTATALDQFGNALATQPAFIWSATGGTITTAGLFTAGIVSGDAFIITAATEMLSASSSVTIAEQTFISWQAAHFSATEIAGDLAELTADADADGLTNLFEYALGTDPRAVTSLPQPALDAGYLTLTFTRPKSRPDVIYAAEASGDLSEWKPVTLELISDGDPQTWRARDTVSSAAGGQRFIRLQVTRP